MIFLFDKTDQLGVNTIRTLSIEAVQKANSGHPGLPMGAAPMAYALWTKHLKVNPTTSRNWVDRDRFVLSAGHGSAMLYSLLHLSGYNVTIDDLKNFRQWDSKTPGHPEVHHTDGVEATTGPLGQGIAMAVGMAMAEAHLAATYNRDSFPIMDHYTYAICGDGDLMEGVSQEASSMAGHMKLGKLIVLYDSNDISLDGPTSKAFTENVGARYEAYGWQHILVKDGNDLDEIEAAIEAAKAETDKPTLIEVKTVIGYGAPKEGTSSVHGAPIGEEGITAAKAVYGWEYPDFTVPEEVAARFKETMIDEGQKAEEAWNEMFKNYEHAHPELAKQFKEAFANQLPEGWEQELPKYELGTSAASRVTSKETIQAISKVVPSFWGGSADLSASNNTMVAAEKDFESGQYEGRNIWFGVREFAMAAAMNGIQLHGGSHVYGGTFFVFTDYLRPAIRLAALQKVPVTYVLTHDSVAVGEDGPTHEPIEQLASVRCIPNVHVIRPADGNETVAAWKIAMTSTETPTILVLSRQNLPVLEGTLEHASDSVQKESVLPKAVTKRVAIEAAASFGWERYVGTEGKTITIDHFGASAPGGLVLEKFGFTPENVVNTYKSL